MTHDYSTSRAQDVPLRLLDGYRGYLMTDDYAGYNAVALQDGIERMGCWAHARRKFVEAQKVQPKGKTGRADMALNLIGKLYGIERELKASSDAERHEARQQRSQPILAQLKVWLDKTQPHIAGQTALGKAVNYRQQLEPAGALHRSGSPADRQQPRRECHPPVRHRAQELAVQRHAQGATASAQVYSLIETAKANGQEPYARLRHILERLPTASRVEDYETLLPWNCSTTPSS